MIVDLDDERCLDPGLSGAKGSWLARGRRAGLPILPGFVVAAAAGRSHLRVGEAALRARGSGGARLAVSARPLSQALERKLVARGARLGPRLVVRSSSILEGGGEWAGAFTSYLDIRPEEIAVAVRGCWASVYSVTALRRHEAAEVARGSAPMAVVVQPFVEADAGGVVRLEDKRAVILSVEGSPAPLVQGWEPGLRATVGRSGRVSGEEARRVLGSALLRQVATTMRAASESTGATEAEWAAADGQVHLLQLAARSRPPMAAYRLPRGLRSTLASRLARLIRRAPGPLGEALVLPWAIGDPEAVIDAPAPSPHTATGGAGLLDDVTERARALASEVWHAPPDDALREAALVLAQLRGPRPGGALARIARLSAPDRHTAHRLLDELATLRRAVAATGVVASDTAAWHLESARMRQLLQGADAHPLWRIGIERWEPFLVAVTLATGRRAQGRPSAPGVGAGRLHAVTDPGEGLAAEARDVVIAPHPSPMIAPLLWDAAAVLTTGGGPAAHLFESARALGIPAVSALEIERAIGEGWHEGAGEWYAAVDGDRGVVALAPW